ncbi:unnamed protein product [Timema podura]|uniref:Peptidase S1 domain-containing protein n=1 Tax=Timema podura TaxID=61482 RepID=A0ABN7NFV1_TIMPD|nr:unnamed protein product [Timema podura]
MNKGGRGGQYCKVNHLSACQSVVRTVPVMTGVKVSLVGNDDPKVSYEAKNEGQKIQMPHIPYIFKGRSSVIVSEVASIKDFPFMVSLFFDHEPVCAGTILNEWWVITAAHCIFSTNNHSKASITLQAGSSKSYDREAASHSVEKTIIHNKFIVKLLAHDIALIKVEFDNSSYTNILRVAKVPILNTKVCKNVYKKFITSHRIICAGFQEAGVVCTLWVAPTRENGISSGSLVCGLQQRNGSRVLGHN